MFGLMGNCITWIQRKKQPTKSITLIVVGLDNAGKTTTIKTLNHQPNDSVAPTIGFASEIIIKDKCEITLFDLGGGPKIRSIWNNYLSECHGVIFVVDSTDIEKMDECKEVFSNLIIQEKIKGKPILLLANKQDKANAMDETEICDALDLETLVNDAQCPCRVELTAAHSTVYKNKKWKRPRKANRLLEAGFTWLLEQVTINYKKLNERVVEDVKVQNEIEAEERKLRIEKIRKRREERELEEAENEEINGKVHEVTENSRPEPNVENITIEPSTGNEHNDRNTNSSLGELVDAATPTIAKQPYDIVKDGVSNDAFESENDETMLQNIPGSVTNLQPEVNNLDEVLSSKNQSPNSSVLINDGDGSSNSNGQDKPKRKKRKKKKHKNQIQPFLEGENVNDILPGMKLTPLQPINSNSAKALPPIISSSASSPRPNFDDGDIIM